MSQWTYESACTASDDRDILGQVWCSARKRAACILRDRCVIGRDINRKGTSCGKRLKGIIDNRIVLDTRNQNTLKRDNGTIDGDELTVPTEQIHTYLSTEATEMTSIPVPGAEAYQAPKSP
jgi:hypothetical protein